MLKTKLRQVDFKWICLITKPNKDKKLVFVLKIWPYQETKMWTVCIQRIKTHLLKPIIFSITRDFFLSIFCKNGHLKNFLINFIFAKFLEYLGACISLGPKAWFKN